VISKRCGVIWRGAGTSDGLSSVPHKGHKGIRRKSSKLHDRDLLGREDGRGRPHKRFYEKVIKVKADVAALLNLFSDVSIDVRG
jgi:hypothetical protein